MPITEDLWNAIKRTPGNIAGGAVDVANMALGALTGKGISGLSEKPVGGSDWINQQFGMAPAKSAVQSGVETALGMLSPGGMAKAMIVPAFTIKKLGEVRAAEKLLSASKPTKTAQQQAWDTFGIYKDPTDKKLKTVIPDTGASIRADALAAGDVVKSPTVVPLDAYDAWYTPAEISKNLRVGDILEHPELFSKQPYLADINIGKGLWMMPREAAFNPSTNTITMGAAAGPQEFVSTLLHELQHGIQTNYGFTPGGNPGMFIADANAVAQGRKTIENAMKQVKLFNLPSTVLKSLDDYDRVLGNVNVNALQNYRRLGGEVEARTVQHMFETGNYTQNPATLVQEVLKSTPYNRAITGPERIPKVDMTPEVQSILQNLEILYDNLLKGWGKP